MAEGVAQTGLPTSITAPQSLLPTVPVAASGNSGGARNDGVTTTTSSTTADTGGQDVVSSQVFGLTQGWYITGAIVVSVMLANTRVGPFLLGVLGIALLYQTNLLLEHK